MEKYNITKGYMKNVKPYSPKNNIESELYIKNEILIKKLLPIYLAREKTILRLDELENNTHLVTPLYALYDKNKFYGYAMKFYKDYQTLKSVMQSSSLSFEERKKLSLDICEAYQYMENYDFAYYDMHTQNILYKDGDVKFIDMDSGIFNDGTYHFQSYIRFAHAKLSNIVLGLLHNQNVQTNLEDLRKYRKEILKNIPKNIKPLYKFAIDEPMSYFHSQDYIENMNEDIINDVDMILKRTK